MGGLYTSSPCLTTEKSRHRFPLSLLSPSLSFSLSLPRYLSLPFPSLSQFNSKGFNGMGNILYVYIAKASEIDNKQ